MENNKRQSDKNSETENAHRRRSADFWCKTLAWFAVAGWIALFGVLYTIEKARPPVKSFSERFFNKNVRTTWDQGLLSKIPYHMVTGLIISLMGLFINARRHKRRNDHWRVSLILPGFFILIITAVWLIYILFKTI
ncbi:hypothetical protein KAJ27_05840 [bacterium]|nr:hypothetical protein [bacterium]